MKSLFTEIWCIFFINLNVVIFQQSGIKVWNLSSIAYIKIASNNDGCDSSYESGHNVSFSIFFNKSLCIKFKCVVINFFELLEYHVIDFHQKQNLHFQYSQIFQKKLYKIRIIFKPIFQQLQYQKGKSLTKNSFGHMNKRMKNFYNNIIKNHNQGKIQVSNMQMTTPYYPESVLAKSKFYGFYSLFYMFTIYFSIVYPALNYMKTGTFFQKALFKMLQTNLFWDLASIAIFLILSFCLMQVSSLAKAICKNLTKKQTAFVFIPLIGVLWSLYVGIGLYIVRNFPMYFTDKIFIVVMSWAFCIKTLSYIFDICEIVEITQKFEVKRQQAQKSQKKIKETHDKEKNQNKQSQNVESKSQEQTQKVIEILQEISLVKQSSNLLQQSFIQKSKTKLIYLISPQIIFKRFILNYDQTLTIHPIYVINKCFVSLLCSLVNLIIMIEMIQPLCEKQSLQKYRFIELFFRFIPPIFYINICLYFMILENILPAIAEVTKMKSRIYYEDWWNAQTVYDFLDRWVLLINSFTKQYLTIFWKNKKLRETIHVAIIFFLIYEIFSLSERSISLLPFLSLASLILLSTYFLGENKKIQNNHIVHIIIFSFSPLMLALQMKYNIFTGDNL